MELPTISQLEQIEERRALIMSLQALLDLELLSIVTVLMDNECELADLAQLCRQEPSLARGPLSRLRFLELIETRNEEGRIICTLNRRRFHALNGMLQRLSKDLLAERLPTPADQAGLDEERRRILQSCFHGDQLKEIPSNPRRLEVVLYWLVEQFEPERRYPEREVNALIKRYHPDFAALRRYLIDYGLMERAENIYWRT